MLNGESLSSPYEIRTHSKVNEFVDAAYRFCRLFEESPERPNVWCKDVLSALSKLYAAALELPEVTIEGAPDVPDIYDLAVKEWSSVYSLVSNQLKSQRFYWHYFEPTDPVDEPAKECSMGDLADDLADIYRDVKPGLNIWGSEHDEFLPSALFDWSHVLLETHWGIHAVSALPVLHFLVYMRGIDARLHENVDLPIL